MKIPAIYLFLVVVVGAGCRVIVHDARPVEPVTLSEADFIGDWIAFREENGTFYRLALEPDETGFLHEWFGDQMIHTFSISRWRIVDSAYIVASFEKPPDSLWYDNNYSPEGLRCSIGRSLSGRLFLRNLSEVELTFWRKAFFDQVLDQLQELEIEKPPIE